MHTFANYTTALIFRFPAFFLIEADVRSKNRRLENFTFIGTQWGGTNLGLFNFSQRSGQRQHYPYFLPCMKKGEGLNKDLCLSINQYRVYKKN